MDVVGIRCVREKNALQTEEGWMAMACYVWGVYVEGRYVEEG